MKPEIHDILKPLESFSRPYPKAAIDHAIANPTLVINDLKRSIEWTIQEFNTACEDTDYMLNVYALYLLAYFRESSFLPTLIQLCRIPDVEELLDDEVTTLAGILASLSIEQPHLLHQIIEDAQANEYVRNCALEALVIHYYHQKLPEPEFKAYLKYLFEEGLEKTGSFIWNGIVDTVCDFQFQEFEPEVRFAYEHHLADPSVMGYEEALDQLFGRQPSYFNSKPLHYIDDVHSEIQWWACFQEETQVLDDREDEDVEYIPPASWVDSDPDPFTPMPVQRPIVYNSPKIGRNEPCPCGSGLKYKKCCGKP